EPLPLTASEQVLAPCPGHQRLDEGEREPIVAPKVHTGLVVPLLIRRVRVQKKLNEMREIIKTCEIKLGHRLPPPRSQATHRATTGDPPPGSPASLREFPAPPVPAPDGARGGVLDRTSHVASGPRSPLSTTRNTRSPPGAG